MSGKVVYVKCPRCELNYIDKKDQLCNICKLELKMPPSFYSNGQDDEEVVMELCPVCKSNFINFEDDMCAECRKQKTEEMQEPDLSWRSYLEETSEDVIEGEDGIEISLSQIEEEELSKDLEEEAEEEEEEEFYPQEKEPDDFDEIEPYDEKEDYSDDEDDDDDL